MIKILFDVDNRNVLIKIFNVSLITETIKAHSSG